MSYKIVTTHRFEKSVKRCMRRGLPMEILKTAINLLAIDGCLPAIYRPHKLTGDYADCWECHLQSDWLLVWQQNDDLLTLLLVDTGTHSDLF